MLHFIVFGGWTALVMYFAFFPGAIDIFGAYFGVARGADLLVYISIIVLTYMYFDLLNKQGRSDNELTRIVTAQSMSIFGDLPLQHKHNFVFLIRAYNEESTIYTVLEKIIQAWYTDIVICDDGSTDQTNIYIQEFKNKHPEAHIHVLHHMINRGWWAANKTLFQRVKKYGQWYTRCVTYDADDQMDIRDMKTFRHHIDLHSECRIFLWSRFVSGGSMQNVPRIRRSLLYISQWFTYVWEGKMYSDPHNGYRVLHRDVVSQINIQSDGMSYASEMLSSYTLMWRAVCEVPVSITYTDYSLSKWQQNSNAIKIFLNLVWRRRFYK